MGKKELLNLATYLEKKKSLEKARNGFFYSLQIYMGMGNSIKRPEISFEDLEKLKLARRSFGDDWKEHPARGIVSIPENHYGGRFFALTVEQRGSLLLTSVYSKDAKALDLIGDRIKWETEASISTFYGKSDGEGIALYISLPASDLFTCEMSWERAVYLIDLIFESAVIYCPGEPLKLNIL